MVNIHARIVIKEVVAMQKKMCKQSAASIHAVIMFLEINARKKYIPHAQSLNKL
jgi:hypothetical protein